MPGDGTLSSWPQRKSRHRSKPDRRATPSYRRLYAEKLQAAQTARSVLEVAVIVAELEKAAGQDHELIDVVIETDNREGQPRGVRLAVDDVRKAMYRADQWQKAAIMCLDGATTRDIQKATGIPRTKVSDVLRLV
jgi:hypothetical protein